MRFGPPGGGGKRGGVRVLYAHFPGVGVILLAAVYAKADRATIPAAEKTAAKRLLSRDRRRVDPPPPLPGRMTERTPTAASADAGFDFGTVLTDLKDFRHELRADRGAALDAYRSRVQPDEPAATRVRTVRGLLSLDPAPFAAFLGVSPRTVRAWERGETEPAGVARRFLEEIAAAPGHFRGRAGENR